MPTKQACDGCKKRFVPQVGVPGPPDITEGPAGSEPEARSAHCAACEMENLLGQTNSLARLVVSRAGTVSPRPFSKDGAAPSKLVWVLWVYWLQSPIVKRPIVEQQCVTAVDLLNVAALWRLCVCICDCLARLCMYFTRILRTWCLRRLVTTLRIALATKFISPSRSCE